MKIGVDIRVLLDKNYSGVASFTYYLLKNILKIDKHNAYSFFYNSFKSVPVPNFPVKTIKSRYPNKIFNYFLQKVLNYPKLDKVIGGCDVFYSPHINFSSFSKKTKKVITIHDLSFLRYPEFFSWRKNFWHWSLNIKKNIQKMDKIIAVSQNTKNDILELLDVPEDKVEVIYPGLPDFSDLNSDNYVFNLDYLKSKYKIDRDYILYLGTIEPRKNIAGLISAYNIFRDKGNDCLLVLAGAWGWKTGEIKEIWQKSKYKADIRFISYIDHKLKPCLYKKAKIFVYPSFYEGFGFPPLEAMYFGVPVIGSNVSSLAEVLGDASILINPNKPLEIAEAMSSLWKDQNLRNKIIEKGFKRVSNFSWEKTAEEYLNIFRSI
ncbi:MAG: glycosyltransferase family 1 protein [Patescibacteria group bacterium]|jgi:glycosyltransferase involved in cell wall biosynthesis